MQVFNENKPEGRRASRSSKQRDLIFEVLQKQKEHLSAEEIYQAVKTIQASISLGTVYRNLEVLVGMGLISRSIFSDGKSRYELNQQHHHHLFCLHCGHIHDLPTCPLGSEIEIYLKKQNFRPVEHSFAVYGFCNKCKNIDKK